MSELISEGGFGCIFYPAFNCRGEVTKKSKGFVTKLQSNDFNAHNEEYIGSLIKQIINYNLFYVPVISSCTISLAAIDKKHIDMCHIFSKYGF